MIKKFPFNYALFILVAFVVGVIMGCRSYIHFLYLGRLADYEWTYYALPIIINFTFWGVLGPLVYWILKGYSDKYDGLNEYWGKLLIIGIAISVFHEVITNILMFIPLHLADNFEWNETSRTRIMASLPSALITRYVEFFVYYGLFAAYEYARKSKNQAVELAQLQHQLVSAQLSALRLKLNPHFLFNTLNTISSLIDIDHLKAQNMVSRLGGLLRKVLEKEGDLKIPVREELEFVEDYLAIEKMRFLDRLDIQYNHDPAVLDCLVPAFILQPLVENAIKHGFSSDFISGYIKVSAQQYQECLKLIVEDNGAGADSKFTADKSQGVGLKTVRDRLLKIYGEDQTLIILTHPGGGFKIVITLPIQFKSSQKKHHPVAEHSG